MSGKPSQLIIYTIGHSNRSIEDFVSLLKENRINLVVDIRRFPTSKWEWFKRENLEKTLSENGIGYIYLGDLLGGFRREGFRKYMETEEFKKGIMKVMELAKRHNLALMCAEKIVFRCTRLSISRRLEELGVRVIHIVNHNRSFELRSLKSREQKP